VPVAAGVPAPISGWLTVRAIPLAAVGDGDPSRVRSLKTEETGVVRTQSLEEWSERIVAAEPPKFVRALDEGPANGCHRNSMRT
jgi:hypothetical protein